MFETVLLEDVHASSVFRVSVDLHDIYFYQPVIDSIQNQVMIALLHWPYTYSNFMCNTNSQALMSIHSSF